MFLNLKVENIFPLNINIACIYIHIYIFSYPIIIRKVITFEKNAFILLVLLYYSIIDLTDWENSRKSSCSPNFHMLSLSQCFPDTIPSPMPTYLLYPSPHWSRDSTLHQRSSTLEKYQADCWLAKLPNSLSCCSPSLKLHTILVAIFKFLTGLKTLHSHQRQSSIANVQAGYLSDRFLFFILSPILCFPSFHSPASTWGRDFPVYQRPYRLGETQAR